MRQIKTIITFTFLLTSLLGFSQQDPLFSQYMNNPVSINPAYAGSKGLLNITSLARQQWVGIDGAPETLSLSINSPFKVYNVGVGLSLIYDVIGPVTQTGVYADYAYHLNVSKRSKLSFGIKGGFNLYDYNLLRLRGSEADELVALQGERNLFLPNFGLGIYFYSDKHYLGLSSPKLLRNSLSDDKSTQNVVNYEETHYFLMGGLILNIADFIKFKPSFITRFVSGSPFSTELAGAFIFHDKLLLGLMYRFEDAIGGMVNFRISPELVVGYAYDTTHSRLKQYSSGTHEIMVSYDLKFKNRKTISPRFF